MYMYMKARQILVTLLQNCLISSDWFMRYGADMKLITSSIFGSNIDKHGKIKYFFIVSVQRK